MNDASENLPADSGKDERPRLLIVVNVAWFFMMHRLPIALMARERGFDVHIACGHGEGADQITALGFAFHALPMTRDAFSPLGDAGAVLALTRLYRRLAPDIVHHVTLKPIVYGSIAARLARVPAVINAFAGLGYTFATHSRAARLRRKVILGLLKAAMQHPRQRVVFENNDDRLLLMSEGVVSSQNAMVIAGIGVDTDTFSPTAQTAASPMVLFASRMLREKGVEYFVAAARRLKAAGVQARFLMVGTPDPHNPGSVSEADLRQWSADGCVEWAGFRDDMPQVIRDSSIVCLPSFYREGVPRILLEAASCERALVAFDVPGCRDIVQHEVNGLLVEPHDLDGLVGALNKLLEDAQLRQRYGQEGRELVKQKFALPIVLGQFWQLYLDFLPASVKARLLQVTPS